jgi:hypothetical protein
MRTWERIYAIPKDWRRTAITILITALITGTAGYLLGTKNKQSVLPSQPSPSSQATMITRISPTTTKQPSFPRQGTKSYPALIQFTPPTSWRVYKSDFGYQYSYPPAWRHYPEINAPSSGVSTPGANYYDGRFRVKKTPSRAASRSPTKSDFNRLAYQRCHPEPFTPVKSV